MRKFTILNLFLCFSVLCFAQQTVTVDFNKPDQVKVEAGLQFSKKITVQVADCDALLSKNVEGTLRYFINGKSQRAPLLIDIKCPSFEIDLPAILKDAKPDTIYFSLATDKEKKGDRRLQCEFAITSTGQLVQMGGMTLVRKPKTGNKKELDDYPTNFFDPNLITVNSGNDCRDYTIIEYNPCCNTYTIKSRGKDRNYLQYRPHKNGENNGVIFLIRDFNVLNYDISLTNEFSYNSASAPDIFSTVFKIVTDGLAAQNTAEDSLETELRKIAKLNKDLKEFLKVIPDCGLSGVEKARTNLISIVRSEFKLSKADLGIDAVFLQLKKEILAANPGQTEEDFAKFIQEAYGVSADSLIGDTKKLLGLVVNTKFEYQYNVPQIQNADAITFKLNIKPKEGSPGTINVVDQPITVPIHGGFKVDFTTGIYYGNKRNGSYALRATADSSQLEIIDEGKAKGTMGIVGLMHLLTRCGGVTPSIVFGVGKSLDVNYSILTGVGLLFGKDNRFSFSAGLNFSNVKTLSNKYLDNNNVRLLLPKGTTEVSTFNKFVKGAFFSFTYSLGLSKSTQAASSGGDAGGGKTSGDDSAKGGDKGGDSGGAAADSGGSGNGGGGNGGGKGKHK